jgi:uncharacterized protein YndB with AHSA1/START domain
MRFSLTQRIEHPREAVFAFLSDPAQRPQWQGSLDRIELLTDGPPGLGTRWKEQPRGGPRFEMEVVEHTPPSRWAERFTSKQATGSVSLTFQDEGAGTQVVLDADVQLHGIFRLGGPLVAFVLKREMRKDLARVGSVLPSPKA